MRRFPMVCARILAAAMLLVAIGCTTADFKSELVTQGIRSLSSISSVGTSRLITLLFG